MTLLRHLAGAFSAWLAAEHAIELPPEQTVAAMIAVYAVVEKGLKPIVARFSKEGAE